LLIHGGLLTLIAVKTPIRRPTEAARFIVEMGPSRIRFVETSAEDGNSGARGHATDNTEAETRTEQVTPPPVPLAESSPPVRDASTDLLTTDSQTNREAGADVAIPDDTTRVGARTGVGILHGAIGLTAEATVGYGANPTYARNPPPAYPREARQRRWQGTTLLRVEVLADGAAGNIEIVESSGYRILDEACLDTVRGWKFSPARTGSAPVRSIVEIPIKFRMAE
jgi:protein TonB